MMLFIPLLLLTISLVCLIKMSGLMKVPLRRHFNYSVFKNLNVKVQKVKYYPKFCLCSLTFVPFYVAWLVSTTSRAVLLKECQHQGLLSVENLQETSLS